MWTTIPEVRSPSVLGSMQFANVRWCPRARKFAVMIYFGWSIPRESIDCYIPMFVEDCDIDTLEVDDFDDVKEEFMVFFARTNPGLRLVFYTPPYSNEELLFVSMMESETPRYLDMVEVYEETRNKFKKTLANLCITNTTPICMSIDCDE